MIEGDEDADEDEVADTGEPLVVTYEGRVRFQVLRAFDEKNEPHPDLAKWEFGKARHGMVGVSPEGEMLFKIPGHAYGRDKMVENIDAMLAR